LRRDDWTFVLVLVEDDRVARSDVVHAGGVGSEVMPDAVPELAPAGPTP
jgi:hypothetical protein